MFRYVLAAFSLIASAAAHAEIIDFEELNPGPTTGFSTGDYRFSTEGTMYIQTSSGSNALFAPVIFAPPFASRATLSRIDGKAFDLLSLDFFAGDSNGLGVPVGISAVRADGTAFSASFDTPDFGTGAAIPSTRVFIDLGSHFFGIVSASWMNGAEWHQIDNLSVRMSGNNTVPEPASWALMIAGFGLSGFAVRRRRNASASTAF